MSQIEKAAKAGFPNQKNRDIVSANSETDIARPATDNGQPLAITEQFDTGSISRPQNDDFQYTHQSSFPACSTARTTLYARETNDNESRKQYRKFYLLQHGRQHPAEPYLNGYSEGWDGQKVRQEDVWKSCRVRALLSQVNVSSFVEDRTVQKVLKENLNGFSRYYQGIDGAAFGFATLYKYSSLERAKGSHIADRAEEILDLDSVKLVDYVWRKYKGDHDE